MKVQVISSKVLTFILVFLLCITSVQAKDKLISNTINLLIQKGEKYRHQGQFRLANTAFKQALNKAKQHAMPKVISLAKGLLGHSYLQQQRYHQAKPLLEDAWALSQAHNLPGLSALHANYLGNYYSNQRQVKTAKTYYQQSLKKAKQAKDHALEIQAKLNLVGLANDENDNQLAWSLLRECHLILEKIASTDDKIHFLLQISYQLLQFNSTGLEIKNKVLRLTYQSLTAVLNLAKQQLDQRSQSLALGYLAQLYESQHQTEDALIYIRQAVDIAQRINAKDLLLKWEWQRGRIRKAEGNIPAAIAAYRRAMETIEAIRQDIPVDYHKGRSSFRETLEPVYLGLADLLLQQVDQLPHQQANKVLKEVRQTIELIKKTELEDYFNNRCDIQSVAEVNLEKVALNTATIYPIILPDRLELLVGIGADLYHRTVPINATQLIQTAHKFARTLRHRQDQAAYIALAQELYSWLIIPVNDLIQNQAIDTLVIIPDGALRLVPFAALHDGNQYLIEHYAIVTSPGLTLFDPQPIDRQNFKSLIAGLSRPGPVIKSLPLAQLQTLVTTAVAQVQSADIGEKTRDIGNLLLKRSPIEEQSTQFTSEKINELLNDPIIFKKCQLALELPGVKKEINALSALLSGTDLIDETFVKNRLEKEMLKSQFTLVHIASHGVFGHSADQSFIMTYDKLLNFDELESLLRPKTLDDRPIDLLTLSACQTAEGDDRASLGMSGIAIKAKVRSVLGALWSVSDTATVQLMKSFYQHLQSTELSKAQALQQAQLTLLKDQKRSHPYYWSPFILIGNWL